MLGALAAIGGLFAQAIATYYDAEVSRDQLQQSREDSEREQETQASQVNFWVEGTTTAEVPSPAFIHIVNRSPDPVSSVLIGFVVGDDGRVMLPLPAFNDLLPCTELIYSAAQLEVDTDEGASSKGKGQRLSEVGWDLDTMYFVDRNGIGWDRSRLDEPGLNHGGRPTAEPDGTIGALQAPQVKKADHCGE
ncbi:hypothetical protein AB0D59_24725 [Streptomyces sp. NPDC048417]|uniref:hypothetical protein n=1 Tax=Streptomyces sp. NPDC048417 TaxID=3155387 RepID=UPI0034315D40